jgi:hypothetical protein
VSPEQLIVDSAHCKNFPGVIPRRFSAEGSRVQHSSAMRPEKHLYVYIMTNRPRSHVLYTGVTGNLPRRVFSKDIEKAKL